MVDRGGTTPPVNVLECGPNRRGSGAGRNHTPASIDCTVATLPSSCMQETVAQKQDAHTRASISPITSPAASHHWTEPNSACRCINPAHSRCVCKKPTRTHSMHADHASVPSAYLLPFSVGTCRDWGLSGLSQSITQLRSTLSISRLVIESVSQSVSVSQSISEPVGQLGNTSVSESD